MSNKDKPRIIMIGDQYWMFEANNKLKGNDNLFYLNWENYMLDRHPSDLIVTLGFPIPPYAELGNSSILLVHPSFLPSYGGRFAIQQQLAQKNTSSVVSATLVDCTNRKLLGFTGEPYELAHEGDKNNSLIISSRNAGGALITLLNRYLGVATNPRPERTQVCPEGFDTLVRSEVLND